MSFLLRGLQQICLILISCADKLWLEASKTLAAGTQTSTHVSPAKTEGTWADGRLLFRKTFYINELPLLRRPNWESLRNPGPPWTCQRPLLLSRTTALLWYREGLGGQVVPPGPPVWALR